LHNIVKGPRLLIADDHEVIRLGLRRLFERLPEWDVCGEAATGGETLEKSRSLRPDILLLDVGLPDMDVKDTIPEILGICPAVKIVALAMRGSGHLAAKAMAAGATSLALKSDAASDLILTVRSIWQNKPFLSPGAVGMIRSQLAQTTAAGPMPADLTPRELESLKLLATGRSNKEVAAALNISVKTVDAYRTQIMRKLELRSYSELVQFAIRHKLIEM
jgi:two-component system invasion response regulator UvrY